MPVRFHKCHGQNIRLLDNGEVSFRECSFANGITFSEKPLQPMEIFLIEIEKTERGWSGHLRIGLTQLNPSKHDKDLPQFAVPDLSEMGNTWVCAVSQSHNKVVDFEHEPVSIFGDGEYIDTYSGSIHKSVLRASVKHRSTCNNVLPTDVGSRIGIVYVIKNEMAEMHFIINGEDQGPCAKDIPYENGPLYAVIDVYGTTKQVRTIPLEGGIQVFISSHYLLT